MHEAMTEVRNESREVNRRIEERGRHDASQFATMAELREVATDLGNRVSKVALDLDSRPTSDEFEALTEEFAFKEDLKILGQELKPRDPDFSDLTE